MEDAGFAKYNEGKHRWIFKNGSILQFAHCEHESDVTDYQSQQMDLIIFDESTQFTRYIVRYLLTRNRATVDKITPFCLMATNPGNVGHGWHKKEFVDPNIIGKPFDVEVEPGQWERHYFLPARLADNKILEHRDPEYRQRLENQDEETRRALLDGDWDVFAGQYFKSFRKEKHVCAPFAISDNWRRFLSIDWGYSAPCAVLWHTVDPAIGRVCTYRELYINETDASDVARLIVEMSAGEEIVYAKASPDMWQERGLGRNVMGGESIGETFQNVWDKEKFYTSLERADNRRVIGWMRMREYLKDAPDGKPWWIIFSNCKNLIRTLPELVHGQKNVEDVDGNCEDHAAESARYFLMSRPTPTEAVGFMAGGFPARLRVRTVEDDDDDYDPSERAPSFFSY